MSALSSTAVEDLARTLAADCDVETAGYIAAVLYFNWRGAWAPDRVYQEHVLVDHDGEVWLSRIPTRDEPGAGNAWALARTHIRVTPLELPVPPNMPPPRTRRPTKRA